MAHKLGIYSSIPWVGQKAQLEDAYHNLKLSKGLEFNPSQFYYHIQDTETHFQCPESTQGKHVGDLFQQSLGGSDSSVGKVLNLTCNYPRVLSSIPANSKGHEFITSLRGSRWVGGCGCVNLCAWLSVWSSLVTDLKHSKHWNTFRSVIDNNHEFIIRWWITRHSWHPVSLDGRWCNLIIKKFKEGEGEEHLQRAQDEEEEANHDGHIQWWWLHGYTTWIF